jgi:hypothetical protein
MWSDYSYSPQLVPETYVVSPSVKGERVPVLKTPEAYNQVLAYLVPGTVIEVMFKLDYWLYVVVPGKVEGYIYAPDARPVGAAPMYPLETVGAVAIFVGALMVIVAIKKLVAQLARRFHSQRTRINSQRYH